MHIDNLRNLASNEAACWAYVKELRAKFSSCESYWQRDKGMTRDGAFCQGTRVIQEILRYLASNRFDVRLLEPGHGIGHMTRNYVHAHLLLRELDCRPPDIFTGLIAGTLHDLGCLFFNRAKDWKSVVKHAELGALVFHEMFKEETFGLSKSEQLTVEYAVAAHTNFMAPQMVCCGDGVIRRSRPYEGAYFDYGVPYMAIHLPRIVDRMDLTHPIRVGRMMISTAIRFTDAHEERDKFIDVMRIGGVRKKRPTNFQTLIEFAESNVLGSDSPFVAHDPEFIVKIRTGYNAEMQKVISAITDRAAGYFNDEGTIRCSWTDFLSRNIEPTEPGRAAASKLLLLLNELSPSTHSAWCAGFAVALESYFRWGTVIAEELGTMPIQALNLPGVADDIRDIIAPRYAWTPKSAGA